MKEAKSLGSEFVVKFYETLRTRFGVLEIRNRLEWLEENPNGTKQGAKLEGITSGEFLQDLKNTFGSVQVFTNPNKNTAVFKILTIQQANLSVYMERYPDSDTGWNYTIGLYLGPPNAANVSQLQPKFKIRFDD